MIGHIGRIVDEDLSQPSAGGGVLVAEFCAASPIASTPLSGSATYATLRVLLIRYPNRVY
jgi:hypothetical protein